MNQNLASTPPSSTPLPEWTTHRVVAATLSVLAIVAGFLLVYRFRTLIIILFIGVVFSIAIAPIVDWLTQHRLPRWVSVILIYLTLLGVFTSLISWAVPQVIQHSTTTFPLIENYYQSLRASLSNSFDPLIRELGWQLSPSFTIEPITDAPIAETNTLDGMAPALDVIKATINGILVLIVILLFSFYWTVEGEHVILALLLIMPNEKRESMRHAIDEIRTRVGGYIRGQGFLAAIIAIAAFIAYMIIGLPSPLSLALFAGAMELIPLLGPMLGAIPAILIALTTDPSKIIWVIGATALIQFLENNVLLPRIMHKTVGVNPLITLLSMFAFGSLFGFIGLLLAIPITVVIQIVIDRSVLKEQEPEITLPEGRDSLSKLSYDTNELVLDVRKMVRHKEGEEEAETSDQVEDAVESIAMDLSNTITQALQLKNPS
ncbi:MAG: AI-2E family transporter [Anaerolineales bacterium]|nr:AI-2E family transporter [Anaerolineales bacterium]